MPKDGVVTVDELNLYVKERVKELTGGLQHPVDLKPKRGAQHCLRHRAVGRPPSPPSGPVQELNGRRRLSDPAPAKHGFMLRRERNDASDVPERRTRSCAGAHL